MLYLEFVSSEYRASTLKYPSSTLLLSSTRVFSSILHQFLDTYFALYSVVFEKLDTLLNQVSIQSDELVGILRI